MEIYFVHQQNVYKLKEALKFIFLLERHVNTSFFFLQEIEELVNVLYKKSKGHMCQYVSQVINTENWGLLSKDMQSEILQGKFH